MSYNIGEKPGVGTYLCMLCSNWRVTLDNYGDRLPPCGNCGSPQHIRYIKVA